MPLDIYALKLINYSLPYLISVEIKNLIEAVVTVSSVTILCSIGLTLTYLTTKVPNFAYSGYLSLGIYTGVYAQQVVNIVPYYYLPLAFLLGGIAAFLQYKLLMKPLLDKGMNIVGLMVATLALSIFFFGLINIISDAIQKTFRVSTVVINFKRTEISVMGISGAAIFSPLAVVALIILLYLLLYKTKFGIAMRAAIENASLASVVGINVDRVYSFSWFLSGALGGLAGIFFGFHFTVTTTSGDSFLPYIFASSILGGLNSIFGPIPGGALVGSSSILVPYFLSLIGFSEAFKYALLVPLVIMAIVLLVMPQGILGRRK